ncbi:glycosyltransferase family 39 protein [Microcoleus sp. ARI1-B5]|uniref:ArnT family glycosyltransferase n=1 Tax=unclassified Microcoleus TaxID=2642155 RepID=UPI002FD74597
MNQQLFVLSATTRRYITNQSLFLPLVLLLLLTNLLVSPVGEFSLNDDWIHAKAVQRLLEEGQYRGHSYLAATLAAQAYWAALFCKIFGFSFTILRVSTLVLSVVGAWAMARCGLALGLSRNLALLCGVLVAINPLVLNLSYSFMTDVPFLAMSILSGLFFLLALQTPSAKLIFWGSFFAVVAFFVRQFGVMLPVAFAATVFVLWWQKQYRVSWSMVFALICPWLAATAIVLYLGTIKDAGTPIFESLQGRVLMSAMDGFRHIPVSLCYMGLFALPLGAGKFWQIVRKHDVWTRKRGAIFVGFCLVSLTVFFLPKILFIVLSILFHKEALWLQRYAERMPLLKGDYLLDLAVGHIQLPDINPQPVVSIGGWWWPVTFAALGVAGLIFLNCVDLLDDVRLQQNENNVLQQRTHQRLFLLLWGLILLAVAYNPGRLFVFDRYLIPALPPSILLLAYEMNRFKLKGALRLATFSCTLLYIFSVVCLQDYMGWNSAATAAQNKLMTVYGVKSESIRGIDTFNGWYNSDNFMGIYKTKKWQDANLTGLGPWVFDDEYIVASKQPKPGYEEFDRIPYFSWLGMQQRAIVIYKRGKN